MGGSHPYPISSDITWGDWHPVLLVFLLYPKGIPVPKGTLLLKRRRERKGYWAMFCPTLILRHGPTAGRIGIPFNLQSSKPILKCVGVCMWVCTCMCVFKTTFFWWFREISLRLVNVPIVNYDLQDQNCECLLVPFCLSKCSVFILSHMHVRVTSVLFTL